MSKARVAVVGGGAAGMMAAIAAAENGAAVTLLEKNEKLGKKIYITGKGRCNLTNDCTMEDFLKEVPRNPRFLCSALTAFSPQDMMSLLERWGCPVTVQRGRRVFPASEKASDVIRTLARRLEAAGADIRLNTPVSSLKISGGKILGAVTASGETVPADAVIVATGGLSYPGTGSTGDGYRFAETAGHTLLKRTGVLNGVVTKDAWCRDLQGLALKNVVLTMRSGKKVLFEELGEMLFTHFGISGPLVLEMSCHLPEDMDSFGSLSVKIDLKPGLTPEQLDARLVREFGGAQRKALKNVMAALLPSRMAVIFAEMAGVDGGKPCGSVTQAERRRLCETLKGLAIDIQGLRPVEEAVVTRGGVSVKEIVPATMESRLVKGLYFAGEVLDVDAHTGGYNLQIAWSTGRAAGLAAAGA